MKVSIKAPVVRLNRSTLLLLALPTYKLLSGPKSRPVVPLRPPLPGGNESVHELTRCPIQAEDATVIEIGDIQITVRSKDQSRAYLSQPGREDCSRLPWGGQGVAGGTVITHHSIVIRAV